MTGMLPIVMPKWGLAMEEGTLTSWLIAEGDTVEKGQEIAEIETTKITNVYESQIAGLVRRLVAQPGNVLPVGALLAVLAPDSVPDAEIDDFIGRFVVRDPEAEGEAGGLAERRIERDGRVLSYKLAGEEADGVPAILVHGFGGDSDNWLFNIEKLAQARPVYAPDLPGHGKSGKQVERGDLDELADAVAAVIDETGALRVHLVGHSLGAAVCFRVLERRPDRVASVAGLAPAGLGSTVNDGYIRSFIAAERRKEVKAALQMLFADPNQVSAAMIEGIQRFTRLEGAREALAAIARQALPDGRQATTFRTLVAEAAVPLLLIWGERDAIIDPAHAENLPERIAVLRLPGVGHMPQMEAAGPVNERLAAHFAAAEA
ncbi:acetoin dehydrogenase dihydrolipoyllysine-residue acetyltransferase subunit [Inquilinus limosus]|uniref:acetoin dehydrogenase dihydrolipoyllysine-residue acetyltransferase subunit n=1 Tax=Inquilinus limosus TaxID=171674 RepID=UPI00138AD928|nr:acetoin dehydrogenase dihydrolipoyllysine-residue acetyltransferase subunit [Inquilinus limosus]